MTVCIHAQRPILYSPSDSTYIVPIERAAIIEQKVRQYHLLRPVLDSLFDYSKVQQEDIVRLETALALRQQQYQEVLVELEKKREPNFFERLGYAIAGGFVRLTISTIERFSR